jgi:hypothetical protein
MTEIEQLIEDTKQHFKDGLITRKEMVAKILELKAKLEAGR